MPALAAQQFIGLFAPRGTPKAIVEQISEATRKAMADRELQRMFVTSAFEPNLNSSPDKARRLLDAEIAKVGAGHQGDRIEARLRSRGLSRC